MLARAIDESRGEPGRRPTDRPEDEGGVDHVDEEDQDDEGGIKDIQDVTRDSACASGAVA